MIPTPVTNAIDLTLAETPTPHQYYGAATAYTAPALGLALEGIGVMVWSFGAFTGDHKLAYKVLSEGYPAVQGGHKLGPLLIHVQCAPAIDDLLTPVQMLVSSWEVKFSNGECQIQGSPTGSLLPRLMPGILCTDVVSLPAGLSPSNLISSVRHYTSLTDLVAGWVEWAVAALFEFAACKASGGLKNASGERVAQRFGREQAAVMGKELLPGAGNLYDAAGSTASSFIGAGVRAVGRQFFGYRGAIGLKTGIGAGVFGGKELEYVSQDDGSWSVTEKATGPLGLGETSRQVGQDAEGNWALQRSERSLHRQEQTSWTQQDGSDGSDGFIEQTTTSDETGPWGGTTSSKPTPASPPILDFL